MRGEFYALILFALSGMSLMGHAANLLTVFMAIELLSIPLYVLCGIARPRQSFGGHEAVLHVSQIARTADIPQASVILAPGNPMNQYPTIQLIVTHGDKIAILIAALPFLGSVAVFALLATHWLVLAAGIVTSLVLLLIMKSYVELVRVISDMLLPK